MRWSQREPGDPFPCQSSALLRGSQDPPSWSNLGVRRRETSVADRARQIISFHGTLSDDTHPPYCLGAFACPLPCSAAEQRCTITVYSVLWMACAHVGLRCVRPTFSSWCRSGQWPISKCPFARAVVRIFIASISIYQPWTRNPSSSSWRSGSADVFMSFYLDLEGRLQRVILAFEQHLPVHPCCVPNGRPRGCYPYKEKRCARPSSPAIAGQLRVPVA
jgi:hypothetical protein